jgi:hypothetical protein
MGSDPGFGLISRDATVDFVIAALKARAAPVAEV